MEWKRSWPLRAYLEVYHFVARERIKHDDIDRREMHTLLVVVFSTGLLMWGYAFLAWMTISSPIPGLVGLACSLIHLLSPLLYRFTRNSSIPCNTLLLAGMIHQATFSYFTGGFLSSILIWFGILPMLGGVICGKKGVITWMLATSIVALGFFILHLSAHQFPKLITPQGGGIAQACLIFGRIFLSSAIVLTYSELRRNTEVQLEDKKQKIEDLFRVLFHDLANPLGRVAIGLSIAKREGVKNRGLEIAAEATDSMVEITQNIRRMYSVRKGKGQVDLSLTPLNSSVEYVLKLYQPDLAKKKISLHYHFDKNEGLHLLVEPVSFNNQVLGNIVSNAIKFSPPESQILVSVYPFHNGNYRIEIKDNGIGIPDPLKNHLFDIHKKTSRPGTLGEKGTGFGLHIIKSFVEMYGGQIQVESMEGNSDAPAGTTVSLILKGEWN